MNVLLELPYSLTASLVFAHIQYLSGVDLLHNLEDLTK